MVRRVACLVALGLVLVAPRAHAQDAGPDGGAGANPKLGDHCEKDGDCGAGLTCFRDLIAGGYCTAQCAQRSFCTQIKPGAGCVKLFADVSVCLEECTQGPDGGTTFDPNKCHGRKDVACTPNSGGFSTCSPQCNADSDCADGRFCYANYCQEKPRDGGFAGTPCKTADECREACLVFPDQSGNPPVCMETCTIGASPSCGWQGTGRAEAACLYGRSTRGFGDEGYCAPLCDCDDECKIPGYRCYPIPEEAKSTGRRGICSEAKLPDGGPAPSFGACGAEEDDAGSSRRDAGGPGAQPTEEGGGCGCRSVGASSASGLGLSVLALLGVAGLARGLRKRR